MQPREMTEEEIAASVKRAIQDAVQFCESEIADDRIKAQRYFNGETDLEAEEGRSRVVATKVRDTIRALKPALMRVFFQADKPVEFIPKGPEDVGAAEQATDYAAWKFSTCGGFRLLQSAFHDALLKKTGVLKVWHDETEDVDIEEYSALTDQQLAMLVSRDEVEVIEHEARVDTIDGPEGPVEVPLHSIKISRVKKGGEIRVKPIPPEDFFVDSEATSLDDFFVVGHHTEMRVGDVVAMGFEFERVHELSGSADTTNAQEEDLVRKGWDDWDTSTLDPSMQPILVAEAYMRMDIEGTGVPRLYKFLTGGNTYEVLDYELADEVPFAVFEVDPEAHAFFGRSIADLLIHEQDTATSLLRGMIDNVAMVNTPGTVYRKGSVHVDDLLNGEVGRLIGADDPQTDIRELVTPSVIQSVLPAMQYFDEVVNSKTGVSRSGMGMDPDALQSTTASGVNAAVQAASAAAELIARNLAEGGAKRLFKLIARLAVKHVPPGEMVRLNGRFVAVDPRTWNLEMDMACNVGLGTGAREERMMALNTTLQFQQGVYQAYGPGNGLVTITGIRNTMADLMQLQGVHNADRYLEPMTPEREQQLIQEQAQIAAQQGQQGDPNAAFLQAESMKAQAKMQTDMQKLAIDREKMLREDDRKRDESDMDMVLEAAKILGEFGVQVDQNRILQLQAAQRGPSGVAQQ